MIDDRWLVACMYVFVHSFTRESSLEMSEKNANRSATDLWRSLFPTGGAQSPPRQFLPAGRLVMIDPLWRT